MLYIFIPSLYLRPGPPLSPGSSSLPWPALQGVSDGWSSQSLLTCNDSLLQLLQLLPGPVLAVIPPSPAQTSPAGVPDDEEESSGSHGPSQAQQQDQRLEANTEEVEEGVEESLTPLRPDDPDDGERFVVVAVLSKSPSHSVVVSLVVTPVGEVIVPCQYNTWVSLSVTDST